MGQSIALIAHIFGTLLAAVLIYIFTPYICKVLGYEIGFSYILFYSLLAIWSVRTGQKIESGKDFLANKFDENFDGDNK